MSLDPLLSQAPEIIGALGGLKIADRVFGPTLGEVGEAMRRLTERRLRNVGRVVQKANAKSGGQPEESAPALRAAEIILREAGVADEEVVADYLGGVLASARSDEGDDAVAWTSLISRMSSAELLLHYMLYSAVRAEALGHNEINVLDNGGRERLRAYVPMEPPIGLFSALGADKFVKLASLLTGLDREGMFQGSWQFGPGVDCSTPEGTELRSGLEFAPSLTGLNLFVWGQGLGSLGLAGYLTDVELPQLNGVVVPRAFLRSPIS